MADWFYKLMGKEVGPVSSKQIRQAAADRRIQPDTLLRREGSSVWVSADKIRGLFTAEGIPSAAGPVISGDMPPLPVERKISQRTSDSKTQPRKVVIESSSNNSSLMTPAHAHTKSAISDHSGNNIYYILTFALVVIIASLVAVGVMVNDGSSLQPKPLSNQEVLADKRDSYIPETSPITPTPQKDPVEALRKYAKSIVESSQAIASDKRFVVQAHGLKLAARFEIDTDFSIDVKKSDSLISPYVGEIRFNRRLVYDNLGGIDNFPDKWQEVVIECRYENEQWLSRVDLNSQ